ncbi:hypothetical protein BJX96DRAFT_120142 [Aspergillus floccosus]
MHLNLLLLSALTGSALALPGYHARNSTAPSSRPTHTLLPTGSDGDNGGKPYTSKTTSGAHPTTTDSGHGHGVGGGLVATVTDTITSTTFKPCSTPIGTQGGTTYYSTWLTASVWETTTCFTTTVPTSIPTSVVTGIPQPTGNCVIQPTVTATVTVTVGNENNGNGAVVTQKPGVGGGSKPCERCETITYTNTEGRTTTIVIPPFIDGLGSTATQTVPETSKQTSSPTTTTKGPIGTGTYPTHTRGHASGYQPSGTQSSRIPKESRAWHLARKF